MKRMLYCFLVGFAGLVSAEPFTLASFNVRCPADGGDNAWQKRMPRVVQVIKDHCFDVFGVQEATAGELKMLDAGLPGFARVGCGRNADRGGETMAIFFSTNRFDCLESGTYWLSEHPDQPGTRYTGAGCPRTCTWAKLRDRVSGKAFLYCNTHLDHISSQARINGMNVLLARSVRPALERGETVFLTGDLNETLEKTDDPAMIAQLSGPRLAAAAEKNPIALLSTVLKDAYALSKTGHKGPHKTFHGFTGKAKCRIDYIFVSEGVEVLSHATLDDQPGGKFASDHYPVAATLDF